MSAYREAYGGKPLEFVAHTSDVNCTAIAQKSNRILASGGTDMKINIWKLSGGSGAKDNSPLSVTNIWTLGQNKSPIESLCFDNEEQCIVSGAMSGSIKVFDLNEGRLARTLGGHSVNTG